jgi:hypothetical protein
MMSAGGSILQRFASVEGGTFLGLQFVGRTGILTEGAAAGFGIPAFVGGVLLTGAEFAYEAHNCASE